MNTSCSSQQKIILKRIELFLHFDEKQKDCCRKRDLARRGDISSLQQSSSRLSALEAGLITVIAFTIVAGSIMDCLDYELGIVILFSMDYLIKTLSLALTYMYFTHLHVFFFGDSPCCTKTHSVPFVAFHQQLPECLKCPRN